MLVTLSLDDIAGSITDAVERALVPHRLREAELEEQIATLLARVDAVERREPERGEPGPAGPRGEKGEPGEPGRDGTPGSDGKDADPASITRAIADAIAALPPPVDGKDGERGPQGERGEPGAAGVDGKDADPAVITRAVAEAVAALPPAPAGEPGPKGEPGAAGKDVDPEQVAALISTEVTRQISALPPPQDGHTPGEEEIAPIVQRAVDAAVAAIPAPAAGEPGRDGRDADPELVRTMVAEAVAALPPAERGLPGEPGEHGHTPTEDELLPLVQRVVAAQPKPKDGVGLAGALIDRAGHLVVTLSDGSVQALGAVVGQDGRNVDMDQVREMVLAEVAKVPMPKDGIDGVGFDDLSVERTGDRVVTIRFAKGENVKEFPIALPVMIYRNVYREGATYEPGDTVTWAGALWHANAATTEKPGEGSTAWTLAAKRGRDGKDGSAGKPGERGPKGDPGMPGRDRV